MKLVHLINPLGRVPTAFHIWDQGMGFTAPGEESHSNTTGLPSARPQTWWDHSFAPCAENTPLSPRAQGQGQAPPRTWVEGGEMQGRLGKSSGCQPHWRPQTYLNHYTRHFITLSPLPAPATVDVVEIPSHLQSKNKLHFLFSLHCNFIP